MPDMTKPLPSLLPVRYPRPWSLANTVTLILDKTTARILLDTFVPSLVKTPVQALALKLAK